MWSIVAMFSAASTALSSGRMSTFVLSRIGPVSGARRARIGNGCANTDGWPSQWCGADTQAKPSREAAATSRIVSSMSSVALRLAGLQNGVRWNPIRMGAFPCSTFRTLFELWYCPLPTSIGDVKELLTDDRPRRPHRPDLRRPRSAGCRVHRDRADAAARGAARRTRPLGQGGRRRHLAESRLSGCLLAVILTGGAIDACES